MKDVRERANAHPRWYLILAMALCIGFVFLRIHRLDDRPLFIDETVLIHIAERIDETSPFVDAWDGRLFTVWALYPFQAHRAATAFIARAAVILIQLPALLALVMIARSKGGDRAALLTATLLVFCPYLIFFQRLALADTFAASLQLLAIAFAWRWRRTARPPQALIIGFTLFLAFGAKINSIIFFAIPFVAWLTQEKRARLRRQSFIWLLLATLSAVMLAGALVLCLSWIGHDFLTTFHLHRGGGSFNFASLTASIENTLNQLSHYLSAPLLLVGLISLLALALRRELFLPLAILGPMLAIWSVETQQSRFWQAPAALLLLAVAIAAGRLLRGKLRPWFWLVIASALVWLISWSLPFQRAAWADPAKLAAYIPPDDAHQYLEGEAAGLAFREVRAALILHQPRLVLGIVNNCQSLRYLSLADFPVVCPRVNNEGDDIPAHRELMQTERGAGVYAVLDSLPNTPATAPGSLLRVIESPGAVIQHSVYDLGSEP